VEMQIHADDKHWQR